MTTGSREREKEQASRRKSAGSHELQACDRPDPAPQTRRDSSLRARKGLRLFAPRAQNDNIAQDVYSNPPFATALICERRSRWGAKDGAPADPSIFAPARAKPARAGTPLSSAAGVADSLGMGTTRHHGKSPGPRQTAAALGYKQGDGRG